MSQLQPLRADKFAPRTTRTDRPEPGVIASLLVHVLEEDGASKLFDLPERTAVHYMLAVDKHCRKHEFKVALERASDGTVGLRITSMLGTLSIRPDTGNSFYVTSLRPEIMPPALPLDGGEDYTEDQGD